MPEEPSYAQVVIQILRSATRPVTVNEILARMAAIRPVETRNPAATVRGAMSSEHRIVTLGGRPAHYTWWPRHLAGSAFRQPLGTSDLGEGTLVLTREVRYALWPDFHAGPSRSEGAVTLHLEDGPALHAQVTHLVQGQALWGIRAEPALAAWLAGQGASPDDDLIVRVLDVDGRCYALSLEREVDPEAIGARDQALADVAERVLRAGRDDMPYSQVIPRTIAHGAYRGSVPPQPVEQVLRADLRFAADSDAVSLVDRLVAWFEREMEVLPGAGAAPRPRGRAPWRGRGVEGYEEGARRAWAAYLVDRGIDHLRVRLQQVAEAYWRLALQLDRGYVRARAQAGKGR
ncbi:MAG TPA: hypothetical protein VM366_01535 [Anaerolineae bacterium]|nr:hypothetical protein [Anaerolineae bacterium]